MDPIFVTLELHFAPGMIEPFLPQLAAILEETRQSDGFIVISVHRHHADSDRLILNEQWRSVPDYQTYLQKRIDSGLFIELAKLLATEPRIEIWRPAELTVHASAD